MVRPTPSPTRAARPGFSFRYGVRTRVQDAVEILNATCGLCTAIDAGGDTSDGAYVPCESPGTVTSPNTPAHIRRTGSLDNDKADGAKQFNGISAVCGGGSIPHLLDTHLLHHGKSATSEPGRNVEPAADARTSQIRMPFTRLQRPRIRSLR
jgi:hypothetical protein